MPTETLTVHSSRRIRMLKAMNLIQSTLRDCLWPLSFRLEHLRSVQASWRHRTSTSITL